MRYLLLAAEKGDADAQFNLGVFYDTRLDDNHHPAAGNRVEAIKWLRRAAQQGLPRAQAKLAEIYADGRDTAADYVKAGAWYLLAAASLTGALRAEAQSGFERVSSQMTHAQIVKARRLAGGWKPRRAVAEKSPA
jgi:hypothetical protein